MPNVLLLYPGPVGFRQAQVAPMRAFLRELDVRLVLADDYIVASDGEHFDELLELPPLERVTEAWQVIERFSAQHTIDAIVSQSEGALLVGALASRELSLPGLSAAAAHLCANKYACRVRLKERGVPVPAFTLAENAAQVRAFARGVGYPIVLKGVCSALGRLVTLVRDEAQVEAAVATVVHGLRASKDIERLTNFARAARLELGCDPARQFLVEAFAHGAAVETDGLIDESGPQSFGVTEQVLSAPPRFFLEGYLNPADRSAEETAHIEHVSAAALAALDVRDTGYSIELRSEARVAGAVGRVVVIEVNGRLGWDEGFGELFQSVLGEQPSFLTLQQTLGLRPQFERRSDVHSALAYLSCYEDALVTAVPSREEMDALQHPGLALGLAVEAGTRMYAPPHPEVAPHLAYALASDARSSQAAYLRARAAVQSLKFTLARVR